MWECFFTRNNYDDNIMIMIKNHFSRGLDLYSIAISYLVGCID